jgi:hypothetical protein
VLVPLLDEPVPVPLDEPDVPPLLVPLLDVPVPVLPLLVPVPELLPVPDVDPDPDMLPLPDIPELEPDIVPLLRSYDPLEDVRPLLGMLRSSL